MLPVHFTLKRFYLWSISLTIAAIGISALFGLTPSRPAQALTWGEIQQSWAKAWNNIFSGEPPQPPAPPQQGGSRTDGDTPCAIAPNAPDIALVLSDYPTLTWQAKAGSVSQVEIKIDGNLNTLWSYRVTEANRIKSDVNGQAIYQVKVNQPLQPGQRYKWYIDRPHIESGFSRFQVATPEQHAQVMQDLQQMNRQLIAQRKTGEMVALRRAQYFAEHQLWTEFWQEILSVRSPSPQLTELINSTAAVLCVVPDSSTQP